jgi:hypothetical protein
MGILQADSRSSRPICAGGSSLLIGARAAPPKRRLRDRRESAVRDHHW